MSLSRRQFAVLAAGIAACTRRAGRDRTDEPDSSQPDTATAEEQLFQAVNGVRQQHGVRKLMWHAGAASVARSHSIAMARGRFFSHDDPEHGDLAARAKKAGLRWTAVAENLFRQRGCADPVRCAVEGWLNSPGHRRNMLNPEYTHAGVGISTGQDGTVFYTQIFLVPD